MFEVVRSVLLRPLRFCDPSRLVVRYEHFRDLNMKRLALIAAANPPAAEGAVRATRPV